MNRFFYWFGIVFIFIYLPVMGAWHLYHEPGRMCFGRYFIPIPVEGTISGHYPDGTAMNGVDKLILYSGQPELIHGFLFGAVILSAGGFIMVVRSALKLGREAALLKKELDKLFPESEDHDVVMAQKTG